MKIGVAPEQRRQLLAFVRDYSEESVFIWRAVRRREFVTGKFEARKALTRTRACSGPWKEDDLGSIIA